MQLRNIQWTVEALPSLHEKNASILSQAKKKTELKAENTMEMMKL